MTRDRTRQVSWEDPVEAAGAGAALAGIDYLRAMQDGKIPVAPVMRLLGFDLAEVEPGRAVFTLDPGEHLYNPLASVHGGVIATLLDSAMGCAVHSLLPRGRGYTTLEFQIHLVRAVTRDSGPMRAIGTVIHQGGTIATAEARLVDAQDRVHAHATTTCLLRTVRSA